MIKKEEREKERGRERGAEDEVPRPRMNIQTTRGRAKIIPVLKKVRSGMRGTGAVSVRGLREHTKAYRFLSMLTDLAVRVRGSCFLFYSVVAVAVCPWAIGLGGRN